MDLDRLITLYHGLTPENVGRLAEFYSADAYFKDPFNEVRGTEAIQHIFTHMFQQVDEPRFIVTGHTRDAHGAMLMWEFAYRARLWGRGEVQVIRGASHLKFGSDGKIDYHRDYWDTGEELYMKLPVIGSLMRWLRKALAAG
ncbi:MAG: nuclear transport factor 2 family protein [Proteobacteria bacterium]|nr:nuclear transport factor 2 family protein [Pseudomonadota bacterium]